MKYNKGVHRQNLESENEDFVEIDYDEDADRMTRIEKECDNDYQELYQSISDSVNSSFGGEAFGSGMKRMVPSKGLKS